jgi:hypothetical protein
MNDRGQQRGASFLEFIMVAPIMLLVAGATVELSRFIRFRQVADVLSKEAAMRAYRQCDRTSVKFTNGEVLVNQLVTTPLIQGCLDNVKASIEATLAGTGIPGSVTISMYRFDYANPVPTAGCAAQAPQAITSQNPNSAYQPRAGGIAGPNGIVTGTWGCTTGRVLISEMTFVYAPIINYRVIGVGNSFDVNFANSPLRSPLRPANQQNLPRETTIL